MNLEFWKLIITVAIPTIGWIVGYLLKQKNDIDNAKRNKRIDFLIKTYIKIENCIQRKPSQVGKDLEDIVAEIQLMGNVQQVNLVKKFANDISEKNSADLEPLLISLRNDLRRELKLEKNNEKIQFLRMSNNN
ncbi:hypothetical protein [Plebeiibacterium sediminum]|uniref:Uncharacterized protein n=1 Tax=Plebeiibacterium sediminum TaxID=2992112 RepID=A0AAE3MAQ9_9BACT|nr:hypothetical protein [Plebeiobacterium sediminum]MCW3789580.1 hypothetical protein [Plebeiobacterium sediminum]